jgi:hypothetical protein
VPALTSSANAAHIARPSELVRFWHLYANFSSYYWREPGA